MNGETKRCLIFKGFPKKKAVTSSEEKSTS
jgi:hypothetical protein